MMGKPRIVRFGSLDAIEVPNSDPAALTVICLHGYGADMSDLAPLARELKTKRPLTWLFPNAPEALEGGGRAWFAIDVAASVRDVSLGEPSGLAWAREELQRFITALGVSWGKIVLMGFSQGSMLAADLALRAESMPAGVVILSGALVDKKTTAELAPGKKSLPFFQSHGLADPILSFQSALALEKILKDGGWRGQLQRFEGGHAIPLQVMDTLSSWLEKR